MDRRADAIYWERLEAEVLRLSEWAATEAKRLRPRNISSLGVSGMSGVPFFNAASHAIYHDVLYLLDALNHNFHQVGPDAFAWNDSGSQVLLRIGHEVPAPLCEETR